MIVRFLTGLRTSEIHGLQLCHAPFWCNRIVPFAMKVMRREIERLQTRILGARQKLISESVFNERQHGWRSELTMRPEGVGPPGRRADTGHAPTCAGIRRRFRADGTGVTLARGHSQRESITKPQDGAASLTGASRSLRRWFAASAVLNAASSPVCRLFQLATVWS